MKFVVGVDIGGTKIEASLIDSQGQIHQTLRQPALTQNEAMLNRIVEMVETLAHQSPIAGVGFAIPGSIDPKNGLLRNAPNSPGIQGTPLAADLSERLPYPLAFENDANCLALSERAFGAAKGYDHVIGIILGTGVGAGIIITGQVLGGANGLAPEPGHITLCYQGRQCLCGKKGCVEAYLSGPSILRRYQDAGGDQQISDTRSLFERQDQDSLASHIIEETRDMFVHFVSSLVSLYDPQIIVLGGGLSLQPMFTQQDAIIAALNFGTHETPPVVHAKHGDTSGKLGAAALIFSKINKSP